MRRGTIPPQASRNAACALGKLPSGSRIPASRCVEDPHRCDSIAFGLSLTEKQGYGILWVPYLRFYPLDERRFRDGGAVFLDQAGQQCGYQREPE
jgi:hypothetical protein